MEWLRRALVGGAAAAANHSAPCIHRRVYIDLGVNWANTVHLFQKLDRSGSAYEVYGFEASPLIQPFAEDYFAWLNGDLPNEPESCVPPSGSSDDLDRYTPLYGCPTARQSGYDRMRECMFRRLDRSLRALRPNPALNSSTLIQRRLGSARNRCLPERGQNHYTFIPAAAGGRAAEWLTFYGPPHQLIRGGVHPARPHGDASYHFRVRVVDVASWIASSFAPADYVFLKVDIEGAEHEVLEQMVRDGTMPLVDVLSIDCHPWVRGKDCGRLRSAVARAAPSMKILAEGYSGSDHAGTDSSVGARMRRQQATIRACDAIDLERFALSHRPKREEPIAPADRDPLPAYRYQTAGLGHVHGPAGAARVG